MVFQIYFNPSMLNWAVNFLKSKFFPYSRQAYQMIKLMYFTYLKFLTTLRGLILFDSNLDPYLSQEHSEFPHTPSFSDNLQLNLASLTIWSVSILQGHSQTSHSQLLVIIFVRAILGQKRKEIGQSCILLRQIALKGIQLGIDCNIQFLMK